MPFTCSVGKRNDDTQILAENTVTDEENLNFQSSQLEEKDLQKLEADSEKLLM